jgi:signal transduction histidine kinase
LTTSIGIAVFDKDEHLICWNRQFGDMLALPPQLTRVGTGLDDILRFNTRRNNPDAASVEALVEEQVRTYVSANRPFLERVPERDLVMEVRASRMPDGGIVTTFTDITASVKAAEELERANETLERRVRERTEQLTRLNTELARAKAGAEEANISKTRFLAAASHDILQPLNAARLYVTSLIERQGHGEASQLVGNIDASLDAVEEIIGTLLDISRLDTGAMKTEIISLKVEDVLRQLEVEFAPMAHSKGLRLTFVHCALAVHRPSAAAPPAANLVSNAINTLRRARAGGLPAPQRVPAH